MLRNFQNADTRKQKGKKRIERAFKVNRIQMKSGLSGLKHIWTEKIFEQPVLYLFSNR